jgi:hypothetical protein
MYLIEKEEIRPNLKQIHHYYPSACHVKLGQPIDVRQSPIMHGDAWQFEGYLLNAETRLPKRVHGNPRDNGR